MDKLKLHTPDFVETNAAKLAELFPNCVTESKAADGTVKRAIDFDLLRQELSSDIVEGPQERYRLDWPGKREALALANAPIRKTLRPCKEESVDFETTQNLYIEGDNLDALKLLQETYLGKVKMIYIDPPYNTGNDFIYDDNFSMSREEYEEESGERDEEGNAMFDEEKWRQNSNASGRFHSEWLSMMYPRLRLARNLMADDALIFCSIDENELENLIKICCEVFGEQQMVGIFKWNKTSKAPTLSPKIRKKYEYVVCFERDDCFKLRGPESYNENAPLLNPVNPVKKIKFESGMLSLGFADGKYQSGTFGEGSKKVILHDDLIVEKGKNRNALFISAHFKWSQSTINEHIKSGGSISFKTPKFTTLYYSLDNSGGKFIAPSDLLNKDECGVTRNDEGYAELKKLFDGLELFDYCKPISLPQYLAKMADDKCGVYLDFFSGSGTFAHAIMKLNADSGGTRRHIQIQLPEPCPEGSAALKAGYSAISELGKERIRRAGTKIRQDLESQLEGKLPGSEEYDSIKQRLDQLDTGFRVLKIDSSNMVDVYYQPDQLTQDALALRVDNVKPDRSPEDLLFQVLLDWGVDLGLPVTEETIEGKKVFFVADNAVAACFDTGLTEAFCKALAKREPMRAVFRDASYASDSTKINIEQIFKALSPHTGLKTL